MSKLRVVLIVLIGAGVVAAVAIAALATFAPRESVVADVVTQSPSASAPTTPTPVPTPEIDMSGLEEVLAMEPTERCQFDLAVGLEPGASYSWEEICAAHAVLTSGALRDALGNPPDLSYGWVLEPSTGRLIVDVPAQWVDAAREVFEPFGDLVSVIEGPPGTMVG